MIYNFLLGLTKNFYCFSHLAREMSEEKIAVWGARENTIWVKAYILHAWAQVQFLAPHGPLKALLVLAGKGPDLHAWEIPNKNNDNNN